MMHILQDEREFCGERSAVALCTFDGVHAGHRSLIAKAIEYARKDGVESVVYTFDRNPLEVICPERAPKPLMTLEEKLAKLEALGVQYAVVRRFDSEFAAVTAADFLKSIAENLRPIAVITGYYNTFGFKGEGNAQMIASSAAEYGYAPVIVQPVMVAGKTVSSTLIRALLAEGKTEEAKQFL